VKLRADGSISWNAGSGASSNATSCTSIVSTAVANSSSASGVTGGATVTNTVVTPVDTSATIRAQATSPDTTSPASVDNLAASSSTASTITLSWTAPGDNGTLGNATGYMVRYSLCGSINASSWGIATTYAQTWTPRRAGETETRVISGLASGTTYWFAVLAYDEVWNFGGISNSPIGTTTTWNGSSPPTNLIPVGGGNATTPQGYFEENGFSVVTHGAENVTLMRSASKPPGAGEAPQGASAFMFLEITGTLSEGSNQVTLYIYYNRTTVQSLDMSETTLKLYVWNTTSTSWQALETTQLALNATHGVLFAVVPHFSYFAVFGAIVLRGTLTVTGAVIVLIAVFAVIAISAGIVYMRRIRGGTKRIDVSA
jgi:hypothetical protein